MKDQKQTEPKPDLKRVLVLADFACATGFAQVAQNIVAQILKSEKYQVDVVAINYYGMPNEWLALYPTVRLLPATVISQGDLFGRQGYLNLLASGVYDLTFILQDTFQIELIGDHMIELRNKLKAAGKKVFKWIYYFPIDSTPKENWLRKTVMLADYPVVYTQYGYNECVKLIPELKTKLRVIAHGTDTVVFSPMEDEAIKEKFRDSYFLKRAKGKFLVTNVNRNQPRKDIARTMQIFRLFKDQVPNALLYLHMKQNDVAYGIHEVARNFNLIPDEDYIVPKDFDEHNGVSSAIVNAIYNVSDLVMTTTLGEGWGLSMTESMATKTPVIAPNHTSLTEMIGEDRGTLVTAGRSITDWVILQNDNERKRPLVDVPEFVDKMVKIHNNYKIAEDKAEVAYKFVLDNWTWDKIGEQWRAVFEEALVHKKVLDIGRNDPCYCGSGKKYKHCHLNNE